MTINLANYADPELSIWKELIGDKKVKNPEKFKVLALKVLNSDPELPDLKDAWEDKMDDDPEGETDSYYWAQENFEGRIIDIIEGIKNHKDLWNMFQKCLE